MRLWTAPNRTLNAVLANAATTFRTQATEGKTGTLVVTVVALMPGPHHEALAVFTSETEAQAFLRDGIGRHARAQRPAPVVAAPFNGLSVAA